MKFSLRKQSSGRLYNILVPFTPLVYRAYFKKVYVYNSNIVPDDQPVLLASNHPTAFIDPMLLGTHINPPMYNMTRGDIFRKPFFRKVMEGLNMFPVFRKRDGFTQSDRNDEVFDFCVEKMHQKRVLCIYVEGEHHSDKRIRPIKKGLARIAFAAYEKHALSNLQIIPAGINFTGDGQPRTSAFVNFGPPMFVRDYWDMYLENPGKAIFALCRDIEEALKVVSFHIEDPNDDLLVEQLLEMHRSNHPEPLLPLVIHGNQNKFLKEKNLINNVNSMKVDNKTALKEAAQAYYDKLSEAGLKDEALCHPSRGSLWRLLYFAGGFLPFLMGRVGCYPVLGAAKYVADTKVSKHEFYGSVRMGVGFVAGMVYFPLVFCISLFSGNALIIGLAILLPVLGWFAMVYRESFIRWYEARRAVKHPNRMALLEQRAALMQFWDNL